MISFKQFLSEEQEDLVKFVHDHCEQAVDDSLKAKACLWRGLQHQPTGEKRTFTYEGRSVDGVIVKRRSDRAPRDMPKWAHTHIDDLFEKEFSVRLRSETVFCYARPRSGYGAPHAVIPMYRYDIYTSPAVEDLTTYLFPDFANKGHPGLAGGLDHWNQRGKSEAQVTREDELEYITSVVENSDYKSHENVSALDTQPGNEKMVYCDYYLLLPDFDKWEEVHDLFTRAKTYKK